MTVKYVYIYNIYYISTFFLILKTSHTQFQSPFLHPLALRHQGQTSITAPVGSWPSSIDGWLSPLWMSFQASTYKDQSLQMKKNTLKPVELRYTISKRKKATNEKSWKESHEKNDHSQILVDLIINSTLIHLERWKNHMIRCRFYPKKTALWKKKANRVQNYLEWVWHLLLFCCKPLFHKSFQIEQWYQLSIYSCSSGCWWANGRCTHCSNLGMVVFPKVFPKLMIYIICASYTRSDTSQLIINNKLNIGLGPG